MDQAISLQGFIPIRKEPSERSEMVSQVLFGETVNIMDRANDWILIELSFDGYSGWIDRFTVAEPDSFESPSEDLYIVADPVIKTNRKKTNTPLFLPAGSVANGLAEKELSVNGEKFILGTASVIVKPSLSVDLEGIAKKLVSIPYLWGGRCGFGFDCSGLSQFLCRIRNTDIPRDSIKQSEIGEPVNFIHEAEPGDLAFFDNIEGEITHVGVVLEGGRIIHSSGHVKIDRLDQQGIFNIEKGKYTHRLRVIKRVQGSNQ